MLNPSTPQMPQMMMVAGFVLLGWILLRRQLRARRRIWDDERQHQQAVRTLAHDQRSGAPLADAPVETLRWQGAMFDLQREMQAELETKICVVQSLLRQVDQRMAELRKLQETTQQDRTIVPSASQPIDPG